MRIGFGKVFQTVFMADILLSHTKEKPTACGG
jgi:hypothetical protein